MTAASNSEARKRNAPVADPVEVVARELRAFPDAALADRLYAPKAAAIVAALRAEGLL